MLKPDSHCQPFLLILGITTKSQHGKEEYVRLNPHPSGDTKGPQDLLRDCVTPVNGVWDTLCCCHHHPLKLSRAQCCSAVPFNPDMRLPLRHQNSVCVVGVPSLTHWDLRSDLQESARPTSVLPLFSSLSALSCGQSATMSCYCPQYSS